MSEEKFGLIRKDFNLHAGTNFKLLFGDYNFTDITLVSADNQQIPAHKVILSNGSPFFREIFLRNPHPQPLLYLRIRYSDLLSLVRFIYLGECEVDQRDIDQFLKTALDLRLEGISSEDGVKVEEQLVSEREKECFGNSIEERYIDMQTNIIDNNTDFINLDEDILEDTMTVSKIDKESTARNKLDIEKNAEEETMFENTIERKIHPRKKIDLDKESKVLFLENQLRKEALYLENKLRKEALKLEDFSLHKSRFLKLLQENKSQKGNNQKSLKTEKDYAKTLQRMVDIESGRIRPALQDSYARKKYEVKEFEIDGIVSTRLVKKGTNKKVLSDEEIFEVLHKLHINSGHSGHRDTMIKRERSSGGYSGHTDRLRKSVKRKFANVSINTIVIFLKLCKYCQAKKNG